MCISIGVFSAVSAFADDEIRFKLSAEEAENNMSEVILVCDRNPGISEAEFNILYNSSIISLNGFEFKCEGFSTEEFDDEGRINVKFEKSENDLSEGGKICSLFFDINNSNEELAGVTIEFVALKDTDGNELSRLVEACDISIPDGVEEITENSDENASQNDKSISDEESEANYSESKTDETDETDEDSSEKDALSTSVEENNNTAEIILLIIGGVMIIGGAGVLILNLKQKKK